MSIALAGALAAGAAVIAAVLALRAPSMPSRSLRHPDAAPLADAGVHVSLARWEAIRFAAIGVGIALTALGAPPPVVIVAAIAPSLWIRWRAERAHDAARRAVPAMVVGIDSALRSGSALPDALARAVEACPDALASRPFERALRQFRYGAGLDAALAAEARSVDRRASLALETLAVGVAERLPRERLATLTSAVADRLAFEDRLESEVRSRTAGTRGQMVLLALLVPAIGAYLALTMPSLAAVYASDLGRLVLLPAAALLEIGGLLIGRAALRSVRR